MSLALCVVGGWMAVTVANWAVQSWRNRTSSIRVGGGVRNTRSLTRVVVDGGRVQRTVATW